LFAALRIFPKDGIKTDMGRGVHAGIVMIRRLSTMTKNQASPRLPFGVKIV